MQREGVGWNGGEGVSAVMRAYKVMVWGANVWG